MTRVRVLGAGVAGLCVAAELAGRGCAVTVFDPAPAADRSDTNAARKRPMPAEEGANGGEASSKKAAA